MMKGKEKREVSIHPTVKYISKLLGKELGAAVYIIGARSIAISQNRYWQRNTGLGHYNR